MPPKPRRAVAQLPVFAALSASTIAAARAMVRSSGFPHGTAMCSEDAVARRAFILLSGTASITRDGQEIATVGPGDIVGELALLRGIPRSATVTATGPVEALVLSAAEFETLLAVPGVGEEVRRIAAER